ncbi:hypothetical protein COMA2_30343 [Candidatus Nitrospira nitrificans]|uniref:Uncharacterized protein n=1 Tax=Candidatus Nitrospira nitrificans TaxID=1742973 RepID=A0A0S4LNH9_9BACT|nr:hypothetical protein COMA2_30343 [Candidatus Nitrospira nitrificans]
MHVRIQRVLQCRACRKICRALSAIRLMREIFGDSRRSMVERPHRQDGQQAAPWQAAEGQARRLIAFFGHHGMIGVSIFTSRTGRCRPPAAGRCGSRSTRTSSGAGNAIERICLNWKPPVQR